MTQMSLTRRRGNACIPLVLGALLTIALCLPARADSDDRKVVEAGPEDGILCCNGIVPFLFYGDEVLTTTGRAGIFKSEHRGDHWQRSMRGLVASNGVSPFVGYVCQASSQPRIVYALAGLGRVVTPFNGLFSTDDFGASWTRRGPADSFGFNHCAVEPANPRTVYVSGFDSAFNFKTWRSTDGGQSLQELSSLPACAAGGRVRPVRRILYVSGECLVASTDGGASFNAVPIPRDAPFFNFDATPDGRAIFLTTFDTSFNPIGTFRSTDRGASFVAVSGLPFGFGPLGFDPTDPSRIYASDGLLHLSTDGGLNFVLLPASNDPRFLGPFPVREVGVDPRGSVYIDTLAGPFRTDDGGRTFRSVLNEFRASSVQDLAFDAEGKLLVGVQHTQVVFRQAHDHKFRPIGNTPPIDINGFDNDAASVAGSPSDPNVILVAMTSGQGLFRTTNGGQSWTSATVAGNPTGYANSRTTFVTDSRVYVAAPNQLFPGLYRSDDAGQSFEILSSLPFGVIAVHPTNPDVLYLGTFGDSTGLFKSTDGGQTLQPLAQAGDFSALAVDRRHPHVVYAGLTSGQVIRSSDSGHTFASASKGLTGAGVHGLAQDTRGTLFVWLRGGGLFSSDDGASSWRSVDTNEALHRSGVEAGRGSLVADPHYPGRVYLGNAGVIQIDTGNDD